MKSLDKCPFCGQSWFEDNHNTGYPRAFWIPNCCVEGYFMLPKEELTEEDIEEALFFMNDNWSEDLT